MSKLHTLGSSLLSLSALLVGAAPWAAQAQAPGCRLLPLQATPCALVPSEVVARSLGVPAASLQTSDNVKLMGRMPDLTVCIHELPDGGSVRVGQIAKSSPAAFDSRYRGQSEAEIAAGMGAGTARAEQAVGRSLGSTEKAAAQTGAAALVRSMQFQPVPGLGQKAVVMYSGSSPNAHLITLVRDQTFVVEVRAAKAGREKNLALARPIAEAITSGCGS